MSEAALAGLVLFASLALFVSNRVRHDLVALGALFACLLLGLVRPGIALQGLADPAVVAVASVLVVGRALELSGIAGAIARVALPQRASFQVQLAALMVVAAFLSAFMNNIAALVITMPLAVEIARKKGLPPGATLMPLAFATILGGMTTLIGTPANLILSSVREDTLGAPFAFFAMTPVGGAVAAAGLLYLAVLGWRLIPVRGKSERTTRPWRVFEIDYPVDETQAVLVAKMRKAATRMLTVLRGGEPVPAGTAPGPGDRLLVLSRNSPEELALQTGLGVPATPREPAAAVTARVVVAHGSPLIGQGYEAVRTLSEGRAMVVAAGPKAARLRQSLSRIRIEAGDQLFVRGPASELARLVSRARLLEIDRFDPAPLRPGRGALTLAVFVAAVAAAVSGVASPAIAFLAAAAGVAALRLIPADEVYRSIDWSIIVLLAAMIPVGGAFESTGAAGIAADWLGEMLADAPLFVVLAALSAGTLLLSIFLNNVATAVIMGPVAIQLGALLGIDPDAALLAVLIGASSDFLTPIGHQNNLLVMGPGGYRFTDFARVGAILSIMTVLVSAGVLSNL